MSLHGRCVPTRSCPTSAKPCPPLCVGDYEGKPWQLRSVRHALLERRRPSAAHASYPLMELRNAVGRVDAGSVSTRASGVAVGSQSWLAACVRHIVSSAGQLRLGPLLQLVFNSSDNGSSTHRFETVSIPQSVADDPQSWGQFSAHVHSSGADGLVLVRPISSPDQHCVYAASSSHQATTPSSGVSTLTPPVGCSGDVRASDITTPPFAGTLTAAPLDGADGSIVLGQAGAFGGGQGDVKRHSQRPAEQHEPCGGIVEPATTTALSADGSAGAGATQYFGLVVQGRCSSEADGCWVLKTTSTDSGGVAGVCTCVHFSLTRVCLGQPLYAQLRDAWLVPQPPGNVAGPRFA